MNSKALKSRACPAPRRDWACGSAMLLVLLAVIILLVVGEGLLNLGLQGRMQGVRASSEIAARCAADAGLTKAVFEMNEKLKVTPWDGNSLPQVTNESLLNSDATFSYTVTGDRDSGFTIESIGNSVRAERKVNATVRVRGLFDSAILMRDTITLYSGTLVDGYDSENPGETDVPVQIATASDDEGSITLKPGAGVDGEVLLGVDSHFPTVSYPVVPDMNTDIYAKGTTLTIGPEDSGKYTSIGLAQEKWKERGETFVIPAILEIEGGDVVLYVTGDIQLGQRCEIVIKPDTSLTIYLDGDLTIGNAGSVTNETESPSSFVLYGTGEDQKFELKAKSEWYGCIYAPNADISIKAGADIYGSFIGSNFENKAGGYIWYDAALRDVSATDVAVCFVIDRWREE